MNNNSRIPYLDGLRGVAILLVFISHLIDGVYPSNIPLFTNLIGLNLGGGFTGVQLFFALSGYLITRGLIFEYSKTNNISFKHFYIKRFWRLYPVLILISISYFLISYLFSFGDISFTRNEIIRALTYTTNLPIFQSYKGTGWLHHCWSLSVEEQFYIFWPFALFMLLKFGSKRIIIFAIFGIVISQLILRGLIHSKVMHYEVFRWDALMAGCLAAFYNLKFSRFLLIFSSGIFLFYSMNLPHPISNLDYLFATFSIFIILAYSAKLKFLDNTILIYFGEISYSLYLIHILFMRFGFSGINNLIFSLILSHISFYYYESPILKWAKLKFLK